MGRHGFDRRDRNYLFIDGGYLRERINQFAKEFFGKEHYGWNCQRISEPYFKAFYYDCAPDDKTGHRAKEYRECIAETKLLPGVHVAEGVLTNGSKRQQKQVDVKLAVDMLSHTLNRNMDSVTLLAGDQDFVPAIEALVRAGMYVSLLYVQTSISPNLRDAADEGNAIDFIDLYGACSSQFRKSNTLIQVQSGVTNKGVQYRLNLRADAIDYWQPLGQGATNSGAKAIVARIASENQFAVLVDQGNGDSFRYTHPDARLLCHQLKALGITFTVPKITAEYRGAFPSEVQTAIGPLTL